MQPSSQLAIRVGTSVQLPVFALAILWLMWMAWVVLTAENGDAPSALNAADTKTISKIELQALMAQQSDRLAALPLSSVTLNNLAVLTRELGDATKASIIFSKAAALNSRNTVAQFELIDQLVQARKFADAFKLIDGQLRSRPDLEPSTFPLLGRIARQEAGFFALVRGLTAEPPWRGRFGKFLSQDQSDADLLYRLFAVMKSRNLTISDQEKQFYLKALIDRKQIEKANFIWLDLLSASEVKKMQLLYDGAFSEKPRNMFFDWTLHSVPDVWLGLVPRATVQNDFALGIAFLDAKPSEILVSQELLLQSGRYLLTGEVNGSLLKSEADIEWQIRCTEKTSPLAITDHVMATSHWSNFEIAFTVPQNDCSYQKLVLRPRHLITENISGQVYFDNFKLAQVE
jgi:hypothetical protein